MWVYGTFLTNADSRNYKYIKFHWLICILITFNHSVNEVVMVNFVLQAILTMFEVVVHGLFNESTSARAYALLLVLLDVLKYMTQVLLHCLICTHEQNCSFTFATYHCTTTNPTLLLPL